MECVEIVRRCLERARVKLLCLAQASLLMQALCLLQGLRYVEGPRLHGGAIAHDRKGQSMQANSLVFLRARAAGLGL